MRKRMNSSPEASTGTALERHRAHCTICRHPRREEIEQDFLGWSSPRELAETYRLASYRAIYRHAEAMGLFDRRRKNIQRATDRIIERVGNLEPNALAVIAAIRMTLNEERKWLDSVRRVNREHLRGETPYAAAQTAARIVPERFLTELAPREFLPGRVEPEREELSGRAGASEMAEETACAQSDMTREPDFAESNAPAQAGSDEPSATPAAEPASAVENQPAGRGDPYNAPGQVAGIPWPWPAKKILFNRRRPWRPTRPV